MASFADRVYAMTKKIPRGKVSTYRDIAHALGTKAYRAVGQALHRNPHAPAVPCHRVIASDGSLGGFAGGLAAKRRILQKEGVVVTDNRIPERFLYRFRKKKKGA